MTETTLPAPTVIVPKQRHPSCDDSNCPVCFADAISLKEAMELNRPDLKRMDALGSLHSWLANNGIRNEVKGWPSPESYDPVNVRRFMADPRGGPVVNQRLADQCAARVADVAERFRQGKATPADLDLAIESWAEARQDVANSLVD